MERGVAEKLIVKLFYEKNYPHNNPRQPVNFI